MSSLRGCRGCNHEQVVHLDESRYNVSAKAVTVEGIFHPHQGPQRPVVALQGDSNNREWAEAEIPDRTAIFGG